MRRIFIIALIACILPLPSLAKQVIFASAFEAQNAPLVETLAVTTIRTPINSASSLHPCHEAAAQEMTGPSEPVKSQQSATAAQPSLQSAQASHASAFPTSSATDSAKPLVNTAKNQVQTSRLGKHCAECCVVSAVALAGKPEGWNIKPAFQAEFLAAATQRFASAELSTLDQPPKL